MNEVAIMTLTNTLIKEKVICAKAMIEECTGFKVDAKFPVITFSKARSFWANVTTLGNKDFKLNVSNVFEEIEDSTLADIRLQSTIIHEVIHTLPGCFNHGPKFKKVCNDINKVYPEFELQRATAMSKYGIEREVKPFKYIIECPHCGKQYHYKKKSKFIDILNTCRCGVCNKSGLTWKEV